MEQIIEERNANVTELHRVTELNNCIHRDVIDLSRDVALLQADVESIKKAKRRHRYLTRVGQYIEMITHARDQAQGMVEAFNKANDRLRVDAGMLISERQSLLRSVNRE